jgi:hypothetical protein
VAIQGWVNDESYRVQTGNACARTRLIRAGILSGERKGSSLARLHVCNTFVVRACDSVQANEVASWQSGCVVLSGHNPPPHRKPAFPGDPLGTANNHFEISCLMKLVRDRAFDDSSFIITDPRNRNPA